MILTLNMSSTAKSLGVTIGITAYGHRETVRQIKTPPDMHQGGLEFLKIVTNDSVVGFFSIDKGGDAHQVGAIRIYTEPFCRGAGA